MKQVYVVSLDEEFEKAKVKAHLRTRKGKMERVQEFQRKGSGGLKGGESIRREPSKKRSGRKVGSEISASIHGSKITGNFLGRTEDGKYRIKSGNKVYRVSSQSLMR